ncbi:multidrug effflux MFS transporter [Persicobacter diffluens]|uniref:Bicyclomycin/multidrug efflux system n=1 Tax=Persicobacter diffluens TaxID=981 RepID=A0AAN4W2E4_9BACT|nr:bicyclomycin/multidrug efflux system [Persicobacter diffluens]
MNQTAIKPLSRNQLVALLSTVVAMGAFAIDMYLPSIPEVAAHFQSDISTIEVTISLFLFGFAFGQFTGGPLSDHFGRKPMMQIGLSLFSLATIGIIFSPNLLAFFLFRLLQGFGGGFTTVNTAAIVKDKFEIKESAKILSTIASVRMSAPMIAPLVGGLIAKIDIWQAVFVCLLIYSITLLTTISYKLDVPYIRPEQELSLKTTLQRYLGIFTNRLGLGYILAGAFTTSGLYAFISKATSIYVDYFKVAENNFPILFSANVIVMILLSRISQRLLKKYNSRQISQLGFAINYLAGLGLLLYSQLADAPQILPLLLLNMVFIGALGFVFGHINSCFLNCYPGKVATANATYGIIRFSMAAAMGTIIHLVGEAPLQSTFLVMFICALLGNLFFYLLAKK